MVEDQDGSILAVGSVGPFQLGLSGSNIISQRVFGTSWQCLLASLERARPGLFLFSLTPVPPRLPVVHVSLCSPFLLQPHPGEQRPFSSAGLAYGEGKAGLESPGEAQESETL